MKPAELRDLSIDELHNRYNALKEELMRLRFNKKSGQLTDTSVIRKKKKDIARVITILKLKEKQEKQK